VGARVFVRVLDVGRRHVVDSERFEITDRIFVADLGIREEAQRLMIADGERDALRYVGLDERRAPYSRAGLRRCGTSRHARGRNSCRFYCPTGDLAKTTPLNPPLSLTQYALMIQRIASRVHVRDRRRHPRGWC
jgi:hypothetical protein